MVLIASLKLNRYFRKNSMKEIALSKQSFIDEIVLTVGLSSPDTLKNQIQRLLNNLYNLANFAEASNVLLYLPNHHTFSYNTIIRNLFTLNKNMHFAYSDAPHSLKAFRTVAFKELQGRNAFNLPVPNPKTCKQIPLSDIDIVIVNGIAFDEKGNRLGTGTGLYDRLTAKLPLTVRKIALALEPQIKSTIPAASRNQTVDIIVTDKRTIYKI